MHRHRDGRVDVFNRTDGLSGDTITLPAALLPNRPHFDADSLDSAITRPLVQFARR